MQGPAVLKVGADGGCFHIFSPNSFKLNHIAKCSIIWILDVRAKNINLTQNFNSNGLNVWPWPAAVYGWCQLIYKHLEVNLVTYQTAPSKDIGNISKEYKLTVPFKVWRTDGLKFVNHIHVPRVIRRGYNYRLPDVGFYVFT